MAHERGRNAIRSSTRILVLLLVMMVVGGLGPLVAQEASERSENDWRYLGGRSSEQSIQCARSD